jgi:hypothetical protein
MGPESADAGLPLYPPFLPDLWNGHPPLEVKSQILEAARKHHPAFVKARAELKEMLGKLLDNEEDRNPLLAFLERRAGHSYDRIKKSLRVLI